MCVETELRERGERPEPTLKYQMANESDLTSRIGAKYFIVASAQYIQKREDVPNYVICAFTLQPSIILIESGKYFIPAFIVLHASTAAGR